MDSQCNFFREEVEDSREERQKWFRKSLTTLDRSNLIFFDPDNGIEVQSKPLGRKNSSKYVYWTDFNKIWEQKRNLLIFQHFARVKRREFIFTKTQEMKSKLKESIILPLISSNVLFLLAHRQNESKKIGWALELIEKKWAPVVKKYDFM